MILAIALLLAASPAERAAANRITAAEISGHIRFLSDDQLGRVLHTTAADLETLSWAGTHGSVASGMQSVAFTPV